MDSEAELAMESQVVIRTKQKSVCFTFRKYHYVLGPEQLYYNADTGMHET